MRHRRERSDRQDGFTLIEIMVVLIILGLLAAIVVPSVMDRPDEARAVKVQQDIRGLKSALKLYRLDNLRYPSQQQGLVALTDRPDGADRWKGPYLEYLPEDPWGHAYQYVNPGRKPGTVDILSFGADGRTGGEGIDADIGSWDLH